VQVTSMQGLPGCAAQTGLSDRAVSRESAVNVFKRFVPLPLLVPGFRWRAAEVGEHIAMCWSIDCIQDRSADQSSVQSCYSN
jgi:hypothetical protein